MSGEPYRERFRAEAARGEMPIDTAVYELAGREPIEPVLLGSGRLDAALGIFGRDPGRNEILRGDPFVGKGGQLIREQLHYAITDQPYDFEAGMAAGRRVFWCNTVPYKPVGNKAWSMAVKRRFAPIVVDVMVQRWTGRDLITCGNVAFDWFGVVQPEIKPALRAFWRRPDRYEAVLEVTLRGKPLRLHPLPHPSPLNAVWYKRFPDLLAARLAQLGWPSSS